MSRYFVELNTETTKELFNKRLIYKHAVFGNGAKNVVSFLDGEKIFYGRIDRKFVPIETYGSVLKPLTSVNNQESAIVTVNFVADMFEELVLQFKKQSGRGFMDRNDQFLSNLKAYKGFVDPRASYAKYKETYSLLLKNLIYSNFLDKFNNFDEFMSELMNILESSASKQPFTYTGYLKSKHCTVMSSGLAIEIADSNHMDDFKKFTDFVKSKNWNLFVNACNTYGFMIDYNAPWRIVADIGAPMCWTEYASRYGYNSLPHILSANYKPASKYALKDLSKSLYELYNYIKHTSYEEVTVCHTGKVIKKTIRPKNYTREQFHEKYDDVYFASVYMKLRMIEEAPPISDEEKKKLFKHELEVIKMNDNYNSIHTRFESVLNKTFDKRGSLSYSVNAERMRTEQRFEDKQISNITITDDNDNVSGY